MTCIVGLKTKQGVLLGADSALDFGAHTALVDDKLFQCAGMWCGAAGDALAIQYLKNTMPMVPKRLKDPLAWAAKVMSPRLLELQDLSTAEYTHEPNWTHGFTVLYHDIDSGIVQPYPVVIQNGRFIWGGTLFKV